MYGKSNVAAAIPRDASPWAAFTMKALAWPAPAPCASTIAARADVAA
jgi:hypothetical protein